MIKQGPDSWSMTSAFSEYLSQRFQIFYFLIFMSEGGVIGWVNVVYMLPG